MSQIRVLVVETSKDVLADAIRELVAMRSDMRLVRPGGMLLSEVDAELGKISPADSCAVVLVGGTLEPEGPARRWLALRPNLVLILVDIHGGIVRLGLLNPNMESVLAALHALVEQAGNAPAAKVAQPSIQVPPKPLAVAELPLLQASVNWVHSALRSAVANFPTNPGDTPGYSVTRDTLLQSLDQTPVVTVPAVHEHALDAALAASADTTEPLAVAARVLGIGSQGFRILLLALAPDLDLRYQRCFGYLLDNMGQRSGTIGLYRSLLAHAVGASGELDQAGALTTWQVLDVNPGLHSVGEPVRLDPYLAAWLLGDAAALAADSRLRRVLRTEPWLGTELIDGVPRLSRIERAKDSQVWTLLAGDDAAGWRAIAEAGAKDGTGLVRVEPFRLANIDAMEAEDCGIRIARMARLTEATLVVDLSASAATEVEGEVIRSFLAAISARQCAGALICPDEARVVRLLGQAPYELVSDPPLTRETRIAMVRTAAKGAGAYLSEDSASAVCLRYPLGIHAWEQAMRLASRRPLNLDTADPALDRFLLACKELATESVSNLADRIEPVFDLADVVLPQDRKQQLAEIVDHIRLAPKVLDEWKFREQLPYGQGVAALFFGPSGTGKTMAAMAIARTLGIQLLRVDLSRVVSKYIGDTEKNIDRIFTDARRSGSALLIDEADALLGKRSEVKDAHDRYANIEVAFLLQRIEAYKGLAILTTNMKQNLDGAFLRRIRFMVDFPRPDVDSRESIWRRCLPAASHELRDADFRQLARRIELTGGHIRQITLRAAFLAAAAGEKIGLRHIAQGARSELAKLGMPPVELDLTQGRRAA